MSEDSKQISTSLCNIKLSNEPLSVNNIYMYLYNEFFLLGKTSQKFAFKF